MHSDIVHIFVIIPHDSNTRYIMLSMVEFNNIIMPNEYPNRDSTLKDRSRPQENTEGEN